MYRKQLFSLAKMLLCCGFLFLAFAFTFGETDEVYQATPEFRDALNKSEYFYGEKDYKSAEEWAEKAFGFAIASANKNNQARAAYRAGLAIQEQPGLFSRKKATEKFEQSVNLAEDSKIKIAAYTELRALAEARNRKREAEDYSAAIELLKANIQAETAAQINRRSAKNARAQNREMTEALEKLNKERGYMQKRIDGLSLQQAQTDLLLAEQKNVLDSMRYSAVTDSLELISKDLALQSQRAELRERAATAELATTQRNLFLALAGLGLILAGAAFFLYLQSKKHAKVLEEKNAQISAEKERSNNLLLNILPVKVAEELKITGKSQPQHFKEATVMFTDFEGFSSIANRMSPQELVKDLDTVFKAFDKIIDKYNVEKIKTIGDAYMCVGGVRGTDNEQPSDLIHAALDMQDYLKVWNKKRNAAGKPAFKARIGIHTGPLVAGVVGSKKFAYDIWGDTVNVAARLETAGATDKVNISEATFKHVNGTFNYEERGKLPIKNLGEVKMFFVERKRGGLTT